MLHLNQTLQFRVEPSDIKRLYSDHAYALVGKVNDHSYQTLLLSDSCLFAVRASLCRLICDISGTQREVFRPSVGPEIVRGSGVGGLFQGLPYAAGSTIYLRELV